MIQIPDIEGIEHVGFIKEDEKAALLSHAVALVMPSRFESLSIVVIEAWSHSIPVIVTEYCKVLVGQCKRANGGLFYRDVLEFSEALSLIHEDQETRRILGQQGNRYYKENYDWSVIKNKYNNMIKNFLNEKGS